MVCPKAPPGGLPNPDVAPVVPKAEEEENGEGVDECAKEPKLDPPTAELDPKACPLVPPKPGEGACCPKGLACPNAACPPPKAD